MLPKTRVQSYSLLTLGAGAVATIAVVVSPSENAAPKLDVNALKAAIAKVVDMKFLLFQSRESLTIHGARQSMTKTSGGATGLRSAPLLCALHGTALAPTPRFV